VSNVLHDASEIRNQMQGIEAVGRDYQSVEPDSDKRLIPAEKPGFLFRRLEGPARSRRDLSLTSRDLLLGRPGGGSGREQQIGFKLVLSGTRILDRCRVLVYH